MQNSKIFRVSIRKLVGNAFMRDVIKWLNLSDFAICPGTGIIIILVQFLQAMFHMVFQILNFHRDNTAASFFCKVFLV
jgi:hypothetical protein